MDAPPLAPAATDVPPLPSAAPHAPQVPSYLAPASDGEGDSSSDDDQLGQRKVRPAAHNAEGLRRPRPSYYYDQDYDPANATDMHKSRRGGLKGVPVFEPTLAEFEKEGGFYGYVKRIEKYGMRAGIVKVIPPKEWTGALPTTVVPLSAIRLREPIEQHMVGSQGLYRVTNVAKSRIWNPAQWKEMAESDKWVSPDFVGEKGRTERSERSTKNVKTVGVKARAAKKATKVESDEADTEHDAPDHAAPEVKAEEGLEGSHSPVASTSQSTPQRNHSPDYSASAATPSPKKKRPSNMARAEPTDAEWDAFADTFADLPHGTKREDYTVELMREIERRYWRTLTFGEPPMYGADMAGSLFTSATTAWNVANLGDLLPRLAPRSCRIPGVVSPYLYFGMWRATFAWHVEDADLYSINYIHFGAPKFWYSVPQELSAKFERTMEGFFPTDRARCAQFLRHKQFLASPRVLANAGITLNRVVQLPGEFILTYPKGYHSGFNLGYNCAESVNFATESWLPLGRVAKSCVCIGDSVNIDVDAWLLDAATAECNGTTDHSHSSVDHSSSARSPTESVPSGPRRKRSLAAKTHSDYSYDTDDLAAVPYDENARPAKRSKTSPGAAKGDKSAKGMNKKAQREAEEARLKELMVCALCPDLAVEGLVEIGEHGVPRAEGEKKSMAHRVCVMFTPATWIELDENGKEWVRGYGGIEEARWQLKCTLCTYSHGTKIQCTKGKCIKSFHVTCALAEGSGMHLDASILEGGVVVSLLDLAKAEVESAVDLEAEAEQDVTVANAVPSESAPVAIPPALEDDGSIKLVVLCRTHNPEFQRQENERKAMELAAKVAALEAGSSITVRTPGGVFEVGFVEIVDKDAVSVGFDGKLLTIKFKNIVWPDSPEARKKKKDAAAKAKEGNIWIYDDQPQAPSESKSRAAPTASVLIPLPYSNYCPTSLQLGAPVVQASLVPNEPVAQAPLPSEHLSPRQAAPLEFAPFTPHVFSLTGSAPGTGPPPLVHPGSIVSANVSLQHAPILQPYDRPPAHYTSPQLPHSSMAYHSNARPEPTRYESSTSYSSERTASYSSDRTTLSPRLGGPSYVQSTRYGSTEYPAYPPPHPTSRPTSSHAHDPYPSQHPKEARTLPSIVNLLRTSELPPDYHRAPYSDEGFSNERGQDSLGRRPSLGAPGSFETARLNSENARRGRERGPGEVGMNSGY